LPRPRIVRRERKETKVQLTKRVLTNKFVLVALILMAVGLIMIEVSYSYTDVIRTPNVTTIDKTVDNQSVSSLLFNQPYNVSENVTFIMPSNSSVHYELYKYYHIDSSGKLITQYTFMREGNASNNTVVHIEPTPNLQGQVYSLNMTSNNGKFDVNIVAAYNITLVQHTSRYIGGGGLAMTIAGTVLLSYAITRIFGLREFG